MVGFLELFMKYMFVGLVVLSLFSFIVLFQSENTVSDQFADNELINSTFNDLKTNLAGLESQTQTQKDLFEKEDPKTGFGSLILKSIVSSGKTFNSMIVGVLNIILTLPVVFLGLDKIVVSVLMSVLGVIIIFGLWAVYKLGG
ncbi:hypothetical protein LCGC14_1704330 [marine sediment metagenome]|uniref:Uncharacterized protein n=1 Tax=marine sediment metagenome TaxID=412755 RepID=A0A0F9HHK5_9ZZZZ